MAGVCPFASRPNCGSAVKFPIEPRMASVSSRALIGQLQRCPPEEWSDLLERFADATLYQTWAYGNVSWSARQLMHYVLRDVDQTQAIAQVRVMRFGPFGGVAYVRWGPCVRRKGETWDREAFRRAICDLALEFVQRQRLVVRLVPNVLQEDPEAQEARQILATAGFTAGGHLSTYRTLRVDLTLPLDQIRKRFDGKWRNQLNAAERQDLTVSIGSRPDCFMRFCLLYEEMMARKRFETTVDVKAFARMQEELDPRQKMYIALAEQDGRLHAGVVATGLGETGIYLLGATGQEGLKSKASYLLQWEILKQLKSAGCRFYDLGGINPESNPGVYHFKVGMGGVEVRQLGQFERAPSAAQRRLLHWAERWQQEWRRWRNRWRG